MAASVSRVGLTASKASAPDSAKTQAKSPTQSGEGGFKPRQTNPASSHGTSAPSRSTAPPPGASENGLAAQLKHAAGSALGKAASAGRPAQGGGSGPAAPGPSGAAPAQTPPAGAPPTFNAPASPQLVQNTIGYANAYVTEAHTRNLAGPEASAPLTIKTNAAENTAMTQKGQEQRNVIPLGAPGDQVEAANQAWDRGFSAQLTADPAVQQTLSLSNTDPDLNTADRQNVAIILSGGYLQ